MKNSYDDPNFEEQFEMDEDGCMALGCLLSILVGAIIILLILFLT